MTTGTRLGAALGASAAAAMLFFLGSAAAAPGDLDTSFGTNGIAEATQGFGTVMALQPDGKILVAGYTFPWELSVARYTPDGQLDRSFGSAGVAVGPSGRVLGLALQPDGKIVATGYVADGTMTVVRFTGAGSLDPSFGFGGVVTGPPGDAFAVAVQPDGKVVVAGTSDDPLTSFTEITLLRLQPGGALDATFGSDGVLRTPLGLWSAAYDVALQPDGKIVVAGSSDAMTLARYETDGSLDRNFGSGGIAKAPGLSADSVALEPDGRIIAAGGSGSSLAVGRFLSDGRLDPSFGLGGAMTAHAGGLGGASDVAVQADGRIVVAASGANLVTLARIRADGSLDSDFGEDGISQMAFGSWSQAIAVAVEPDGRILAAGFTDTNFLLARFRVTTPTTIGANLTTVPYGREFALHGTAAEPRPGDPVQVLTRACQSRATTRPGSTREEAGGTWAARVTPRVTASYRAEIAGERSVSITVQVSPRMMIRRLSHSRVQVRVLYGRALTGEVITLQRNRRTGWNTIATAGLQRIGRTRHGVLSGTTFKAKARGGQLHAVLGQPNPYSCFAGAMSRTLPR